MDRREIVNELQQIVALTKPTPADQDSWGSPEAAARAKGLIREVESWPTAFPPAPFVSDPCAARKHDRCANTACKCACHCPPEAPQQPKIRPQTTHEYRHNVSYQCLSCELWPTDPAFESMHPQEAPQQPTEPAFKDQQRAADSRFIAAHAAYIRNQNETTLYELMKAGMAAESVQSRETPAEAPQQPAEPDPPPARHIETPDELLELLAGVSSDPQIEGLSLAQKASTMALLHIANELHAGVQFQREAMDYLMDKTVATMAPQPMRIYVKHSRRRRVPEACTSEQAAEAQEMARKIVKESEVGSPEDETAKTVTIALMLRRWKYGDDALQDPDTPQQPS